VASYNIFIKPSAAKEIEALPKKDRLRVINRIQALSENPRPPGSEKLSGLDKYRVRQGQYRIVYSVSDEEVVVCVVRVAHRREVYRGGIQPQAGADGCLAGASIALAANNVLHRTAIPLGSIAAGELG
jgi:mRNA interferase RelE/StbE